MSKCRVKLILRSCLGDADLRAIAVWQMEGYRVEEIAAKLGRAPRTVARKLAVIRDRWSEEPSP